MDYRKEKEPTVTEKLLKDAETYLNKHQHVFATKDLTQSKSKQAKFQFSLLFTILVLIRPLFFRQETGDRST